MKIIIVKNYSELTKIAGEIVKRAINKNPKLVLGLASGRTTLELYKQLIKAEKKGEIDFSQVITFNLDEYYPIKNNKQLSLYQFMVENFFSKTNFKKENIHFLNGATSDPKKECQRYEKELKKYKIDLQILGIGVNGHIGFNEPGSSFLSKTRLVKLASITRKEIGKFFGKTKKIPIYALTMGIFNIMKAKKILLLASGLKKAEAVQRMLEERVDKNCPASLLKSHPCLTVILDKEAASKLKRETIELIKKQQKYKILTKDKFPNRKKIVVISPHPDDTAINCGGTIALLSFQNRISTLIMTTGWRGVISFKSKKEIIKIREKEVKKEAKILSFTPYFLRLSFYDRGREKFEKKDIVKLLKILKKLSPDIIFLPQKKDDHPTHKFSRKLTIKCLQILKKEVELWNYETFWDLFSSNEFNLIVPFSQKILNLKLKAIREHKSQLKRANYDVAAAGLAKFRGLSVFEEEIMGFGEKFPKKNLNIELFFREKFKNF